MMNFDRTEEQRMVAEAMKKAAAGRGA